MDYKSYICEHTVEYTMTYYIYSILRYEYKQIIPFYFWRTREGNKISSTHNKGSFNLIAVYARRPKKDTNEDALYIKFNEILLSTNDFYLKHGIPVFAAMPLINQLTDLTFDTNYILFNIKEANESIYKVNHNKLEFNSDQTFELNRRKLISEIEASCKQISWLEIQNILMTKNTKEIEYRRFFWMGVYKPVYFLLGK